MCLQLNGASVLAPIKKNTIVYKYGSVIIPWVGFAPGIQGRHGFIYDYKLSELVKIDPNSFNEVEEGYHSFPSYLRARVEAGRYEEVGVFLIPKGVNYIIGTYGGAVCYASEQIQYLGWFWNPITWLKVLYYKIKK